MITSLPCDFYGGQATTLEARLYPRGAEICRSTPSWMNNEIGADLSHAHRSLACGAARVTLASVICG